MSEGRTLLTGSTGFLGHALARRLAGGGPLRLFLRDPARAPSPSGPDVEHALGSLEDRDSVRRALEGCDRVVHAAALVREWDPDPDRFRRVNVDATIAIVEDAAALGVGRTLVVSSFLALGPTDGGTADERHFVAFDDHENEYVRTKAAAAAWLRARLPADPSLVVVYPGVIYGGGRITPGNVMVELLLDHARGRFPGLPGRGDRVWSYVHVDDVAEGVARALDEPGGRQWILGGENADQRTFWSIACRHAGLPPVRRHIPRVAARLVARLASVRAALGDRAPSLTPGALDVFDHDWALDSSRAKRELGWAPRSLDDGLRETIAWLRAEGRL